MIAPCKCILNDFICGGDEVINLKRIFNILSNFLPDEVKQFDRFVLNNTAITELQENTFSDITFERIHFENAYNLVLIDKFAFSGSSLTIKKLTSIKTPLTNSTDSYDLFTAISLMVNLEELSIKESNIIEIPTDAFRQINGQQKNLKLIEINSALKKIGKNSLENLPSLKTLRLNNNNINYVSESAFNTLKENKLQLDIQLNNNQLGSTSFHSLAFSNLKRPIYLNLNHNAIKYLDKVAFESMLNKNKMNRISINRLDCDDCRSHWLLENHYSTSQLDITCSNGRKLLDNFNFASCSNKNQFDKTTQPTKATINE